MNYRKDVLHSSYAEISVENLIHNFDYLQKKAGNYCQLLPMVKTNAYGHDLNLVQKELSKKNIAGLGVASITEALKLRELGFAKLILCFGRISNEILQVAIENNVTLVLHSTSDMQLFTKSEHKPDVHLEIETGMNRLGIQLKDLQENQELFKEVQPYCKGMFSHFSESEIKDDAFTNMQMEAFTAAKNWLHTMTNSEMICHISNSGSILQHPAFSLDWVRPGIALYGYDPVTPSKTNLRPVLSWKAPIIQIKTIQAGDRVGYGRQFIAKKPMIIATVSIGYGDGFLRLYSQVGLGYQKKRMPIIGNVCMDLVMIDISAAKDPQISDEVHILGDGAHGEATAEEFAKVDQTICYEVLSRISRRVVRIQT